MFGKKMKTAFVLFSLVAMLLLSSTAFAVEYENRTEGNFTRNDQEDVLNQGDLPELDVIWVKIDGDIVENGDEVRLNLERDQEVEVKVEIMGNEDFDDVTIEARVYGDDHNRLSDDSETFDIREGRLYIKELDLELPSSMDMDAYDLRVTVAGRTGAVKTYNYPLYIDAKKNAVSIRDVTFNPSNEVKAGRALLGVVRVKNIGTDDQDSVKVKVEIPELNLYAVDYIDELESDDSVSSEEMYMRIPSTANTGDYEVMVTVEYDDGYKETEERYNIYVVGDEDSQSGTGDSGSGDGDNQPGKVQITAGPQTQDTARGQGGVIYPVSVTNTGSDAKSFSVAVSGVESFGTVKVSPSTLSVVESGATETFYVYVSANEDSTLGSHTFGVKVSSNDETLKEFPLNVNVVEGEPGSEEGGWDSVKKGLLVGLVVLIVLLVILGLIIAFNKMKGTDDEDEEDEFDDSASQTYY
ncbi:putative S-layer protein [Candidatus Woesearchaeota archaeon]|nr:putative S-layer protein [Candidatus Woesearchaeota archaeon]